MASFAPLIPTVVGATLGGPAGSIAGGVLSGVEAQRDGRFARAEAEQAMTTLRDRQALDTAAAETAAANERARLSLDAASDERRRRDALRRAVGAGRADMAARGLDGDGGSGEAILLGLTSDAAAGSAEADAARRLREKAIDDGLATREARNLLERTDLAERQRLRWLARFG